MFHPKKSTAGLTHGPCCKLCAPGCAFNFPTRPWVNSRPRHGPESSPAGDGPRSILVTLLYAKDLEASNLFREDVPGLNETRSHGNEAQTQGQGLPNPPGEAEGGPEHRPPSIPRPCNTRSTRHAGKEGERGGRREQGREGRREEKEGGRREKEEGVRRGKEGGGLNEPEEEKDRCCFGGGRGALVLLLRSLSLALYSASVPGQGARRVRG